MSQSAKRGLLVLGSIGITAALLGLIELLLAWFDIAGQPEATAIRFDGAIDPNAPVTIWDRDLLYRLAPDSDFLGYYRTNSLGYRGRDPAVPKPDDVTRVVCLGDSCTFGLGVPEEQIWPTRLEALLERGFEGERRFEVLTVGVPGYSSFQNRRQIEVEARSLAADLLIWMPTGYNDALASAGRTDRERAAGHRSLRARLRQTRIARLLGAEAPMGDRGGADLATQVEGAPRVPVTELDEHLRGASESARRDGLPLLLVVPALTPKLTDNDPSIAERQHRLGSAAAELRLTITDPNPDFDDLAPLPRHVDDIHPNETGHRLIAGAVFRTLIESDDLLPASPRRAWLRAFLRARDAGLDAETERILADDGPARGESSVPSGPYPSGALYLRAATESGEARAESLARARQIDEFVTTPDPLRRLLFGAADPDDAAPSPARVELARRLASFDADLGLDAGRRVDRRLLAAIAAIEGGRPDQALDRIAEVLSLDPSSVDARYHRITALRQLERHREAMEEITALAVDAPDDPRVLVQLGLMALERGRVDPAFVALTRATELDPVSVEAHYGLGRILLLRDQLDAAEAELRKAFAVHQSMFPDIPALLAEIQRRRAGGA